MTQEQLVHVAKIRQWLEAYRPNEEYSADKHIRITCLEALLAVEEGNFGIGAVLVDTKGAIVEGGHNQLFTPYFRSDRHAEMVVMNKFEQNNPGITKWGCPKSHENG